DVCNGTFGWRVRRSRDETSRTGGIRFACCPNEMNAPANLRVSPPDIATGHHHDTSPLYSAVRAGPPGRLSAVLNVARTGRERIDGDAPDPLRIARHLEL